MKKKSSIIIPCDVPGSHDAEYVSNYQAITHNTDNLLLFVCDHKMEHLNDDFAHASDELRIPEHLFEIAQNQNIGAFATHLGLIARYAKKYSNINYVVKLNGKTNAIKNNLSDPYSPLLWSVHDIINFKRDSGLKIRGVGITLYLGSQYESQMLKETAQAIFQAHQHGLIAIVWIYARGAAVQDERAPEYVIGAAGVAVSLGADFVKLKMPEINGSESTTDLRRAVLAAGNTKIVCSGGNYQDIKTFLQSIHNQLQLGGNHGLAVGRNLFQRNLQSATQLIIGLNEIIYKGADVEHALQAALAAR